VDDKQDVLPVVGVLQLDGNDLQLAFSFVAADVPPARAPLVTMPVGVVRAMTYRAELRPTRCFRDA